MEELQMDSRAQAPSASQLLPTSNTYAAGGSPPTLAELAVAVGVVDKRLAQTTEMTFEGSEKIEEMAGRLAAALAEQVGSSRVGELEALVAGAVATTAKLEASVQSTLSNDRLTELEAMVKGVRPDIEAAQGVRPILCFPCLPVPSVYCGFEGD
jgi:hypothetical protein